MIEETYIQNIAGSVRNFKKTGPLKYKFSCPICGDSKKYRSMARGNFYMYKGEWMYNCYNCGKSYPFGKFLELYFPDLYDDYIFDKFGYSKKKKKSDYELPVMKREKPKFKSLLLSGDDIMPLNAAMEHEAVEYLKSRDMTDEMIDSLYYTENFAKWVNDTLIPNKFKNTDRPDPRIVIPFLSLDNRLIGVQGRSTQKDIEKRYRYMTIKLIHEDEPLLYGLDKVDQSKDVFVLEGPIDAMFIDNAVAWAGGSLDKVDGVLYPILVWDNEPRNKDINKQIQKAINIGHRIVVWPKNNHKKDINDMILAGMEIDAKYLKENTYKGLEAQLMFDQWRK